MAYGSSWKAAARDNWGYAPRVRLLLRLNDGPDATPGTLLTLATDGDALSVNPILREVERTFGVVESQSWQIECVDADAIPAGEALDGCWAAIQVGYMPADVWETVATGKVAEAVFGDEYTVRFEIEDSLAPYIDAELERDIVISDTAAGCGVIRTEEVADGSDDYNNDIDGDGVEEGGVTIIGTPATGLVKDETFIIEFTSPTAFKVILENDDDSQTGNTSADCDIVNQWTVTPILRIAHAGWDGTYASGDRYRFDTSRMRWAGGNVTYSLAKELIEGVAATVLNVSTGSSASIIASETDWYNATQGALLRTVYGTFDRGSSVIELIQQLLMIESSGLWVNALGRFELRQQIPGTETEHTFNGDPAHGDVDILSCDRRESAREGYNVVEVHYKDHSTLNDRTIVERDDDSPYHGERKLTISLEFGVLRATARYAASRALARFRRARERLEVRTLFSGATVLPGQRVVVRDPRHGTRQLDVLSVEMDPISDEASIICLNEPLNDGGYFIIGTSTIGGPDPIW